uniref:Uncharacterized protein n=1 Tax=Oryza barthii TaxID=65489 RepID=A0A0D3FB82_9ORYZ
MTKSVLPSPMETNEMSGWTIEICLRCMLFLTRAEPRRGRDGGTAQHQPTVRLRTHGWSHISGIRWRSANEVGRGDEVGEATSREETSRQARMHCRVEGETDQFLDYHIVVRWYD